MKLICRQCGRDLNEIWQDNMAYSGAPLCEDCANGNPVHNQHREREETDEVVLWPRPNSWMRR